ncbi:BnaUnng03340D [Brassica napus]|uniref:BnaUnng03340D protein n=1 Tax=Brassica napus TaxID=3708 RepID=A0A078JT78_BRANA|nr:BnaUnng03340D [Brassica napus]
MVPMKRLKIHIFCLKL